MASHITFGKLESDKADSMNGLRSHLGDAVALPPSGENRDLGGGSMVVTREYTPDDFESLVILDDDDVRPSTVHAWPIRDKAEVLKLVEALGGKDSDREYIGGRLAKVDPTDVSQMLYAVGRMPGRATGYLHAERTLTLGGKPDDAEVSYWLKLETMYLTPMERGRRTSYGFVALLNEVVQQEVDTIVTKAKPILGSMGMNVYLSAEVEDVPDNRVMRRVDTAFEMMEDLLRTDHPDVSFDTTVDHDNVPISFATPR